MFVYGSGSTALSKDWIWGFCTGTESPVTSQHILTSAPTQMLSQLHPLWLTAFAVPPPPLLQPLKHFISGSLASCLPPSVASEVNVCLPTLCFCPQCPRMEG